MEAPKRTRPFEDPEHVPNDIPKKMRISETDDEKTKERKRKQIKRFKRKMKVTEKERDAEERRQQWQNFKRTKLAKSKPGFFTGKQKTSMFSLPDNPEAKVGVMGSGRGVTPTASAHRPPVNPNRTVAETDQQQYDL